MPCSEVGAVISTTRIRIKRSRRNAIVSGNSSGKENVRMSIDLEAGIGRLLRGSNMKGRKRRVMI